ncbi:MAG: NAD(P)/FAD-dependent oxidoreductase [Mycetocola sp.]
MTVAAHEFLLEVAGKDIDVDALRRKYEQEQRKRLRRDASEQYVHVTAEFSHYEDDPYSTPIERDPVVDEVEAVVLGAGHGGLLAASRLRQAGLNSIRLIDRAGDVGGVWYWNRYPGIQCDVESYIYLPFLEELGYIPERRYSFGAEILTHAQRIARHFDLYRDALFQTVVTDARWDDDAQRWQVQTDRGDRILAQFLVVANGVISRPKLPGIPGINEFKGHTFHTSRWDFEYTGGDADGNLDRLADKRVGIVGTGATAIQAVPHLGKSAKELYVFQRTPAVVGERGDRLTDREWAAGLQPGWQTERVDNFTAVTSGVEQHVDLVGDSWTELQRAVTQTAVDRVAQRVGRDLTPEEADLALEISDFQKGNELRHRIESVVEDEQTAEALKPWWYLYCKRPGFHDGYLPTFNLPSVTLVDTSGAGVEQITETGVVVAGRHIELDCLIFASGFEVAGSFTKQAGFDPMGRAGVVLSEHWREGPRTVFGMQSHGFPNLFIMGVIQNGSTLNVTHLLDQQSQHIAYIVSQIRDRGLSSLEPTLAAEDAWRAEMLGQVTPGMRDRWLKCTPSYFNSEGDLDNTFGFFIRRYAGGPQRFFALLRHWRESGGIEEWIRSARAA